MLADGSYNYEYDGEGNRTKRTEIATGKITEYIWDYRNRLTTVLFKDVSSNVLKTIEYLYDGNNQRIGKKIDGAVTERYVIDRNQIALVFDAVGIQTHRYLYGAGVDQVVADSYSSTLDAIVVKLQLVNAGINCPNCNEYISQVHQTRSVLVRDLSIFGQIVYLRVPRRQFYCSTCKKSPTEPLIWVNRKQRQTNRYQEYIYERVKELTVKQVSENEKMSEDAVQDIFHKVASSKKSGCALVGFPDGLAHQAKLGIS